MYPDITNYGELFPDIDYKNMSALSLAFIGDAVYELVIRQYILSKGDARVKTLHNTCVGLVNADRQAQLADFLIPLLREDETAVYKRGRNAHAGHTPKNKSEAVYHKSTGFEALVGYLFLKKDYERLFELFTLILSRGDENE